MRHPVATPLAALLCLEAGVLILSLGPTTTLQSDSVGSSSHLVGTRWWSQHTFPFDDGNRDVSSIKSHFTRRQWRHFSPKRCQFDPGMVRATLRGMHSGLKECERQMSTEKWNCSRYTEHYHTPSNNIFGKLLWKGIPETAFVLAIVSAGVTASVASECRRSLTCCPCRRYNNYRGGGESLTHAGCEHNIRFARRFAKKIFDRSESGRDIRYLAMLHNYNAGRRAVASTMKQKCLCHGTSGSCTHRTCWREVAAMREIGAKLKMRYSNAVRVERGSPVRIYAQSRRHRSGRGRRRRRLNIVLHSAAGGSSGGRGPGHPAKSDLVFYESVPDRWFCRRRLSWGVMGTTGRICNVPGGNCSEICCNDTFKIEYYKHIDTKCNCKFVWCCNVTCHTCITDRMRHICD